MTCPEWGGDREATREKYDAQMHAGGVEVDTHPWDRLRGTLVLSRPNRTLDRIVLLLIEFMNFTSLFLYQTLFQIVSIDLIT